MTITLTKQAGDVTYRIDYSFSDSELLSLTENQRIEIFKAHLQKGYQDLNIITAAHKIIAQVT